MAVPDAVLLFAVGRAHARMHDVGSERRLARRLMLRRICIRLGADNPAHRRIVSANQSPVSGKRKFQGQRQNRETALRLCRTRAEHTPPGKVS
jgi:hypothetical protein